MLCKSIFSTDFVITVTGEAFAAFISWKYALILPKKRKSQKKIFDPIFSILPEKLHFLSWISDFGGFI